MTLLMRGAVDIDVDLLRAGRERVEPAGHPVVEPRADVHHHVALVHRQVGFVGAVHAEHAEPVGVIGREGAEAHQRRGHRRAGQALELAQQLGRARAGVDHPAAGVEDRALGVGDQLDRLGDLVGRGDHARRVALGALRRRVAEGGGGDLDVLGDVDHDRAGAAGHGDLERLVDRRGEVGRVLHQVVVLGAVAREADRVGFLERVGADQVGRDLAGDDHQRDRVHERVGDAGDRVGRAGARGDEHHAGLAGRAGIALGGVRRAGFVPHEDVADPVVAEQFVVDRQHRAARVAEHEFDALTDQAFDQYRSAAAFLGHVQYLPAKNVTRRDCLAPGRSSPAC